MARTKANGNIDEMRNTILCVSAKSFLKKGYTATTLKEIANLAGVNIGSLLNIFRTKEDLLVALVKYVLEGQFTATIELLKDKTDDKILLYAAETTLQLYMAESSEWVRDTYNMAYSLPKSMETIQQTITEKLSDLFKEYLPRLETKDFYMLEIASGGVMRAFMNVQSSMWIPMDKKVASFLTSTFKIYDIPQTKIDEAIAFVQAIDYKDFAQQTIDNMLQYLEKRICE